MFDTTTVVLAYSVGGLTVRNNRHEETTTYPGKGQRMKRFDITDSSDVHVEDPER